MKAYLLLLGCILLLASCERAQKVQETAQAMSALKEAGENLESSMKETQDRHAERAKKGDTLALPYKELENYLPATVAGYTAEAPTGESTTTAGLSFSTAERHYTQGDKTVEVKLIDYNGAYKLFQGVSAMASMGMSMQHEDDERLVRASPLKQAGIRGTESLEKKDGEAELRFVAGDRFLVSIKANQQKDFALVEQVAQQLDLAKLTAL